MMMIIQPFFNCSSGIKTLYSSLIIRNETAINSGCNDTFYIKIASITILKPSYVKQFLQTPLTLRYVFFINGMNHLSSVKPPSIWRIHVQSYSQ
jgi:hypothetical protein